MNIYLKELGIRGLHRHPRLALHQPDAHSAGDVVVHSLETETQTKAMLKTESIYERMLGVQPEARWLTPLLLVGVLASAYYPFMKVDKNFDSNQKRALVQVTNMDQREPFRWSVRRNWVTQVEKRHSEPHRKDLMARSIYSFLERSLGDAAPPWSYLTRERPTRKNIGVCAKALRDMLAGDRGR
jgi:hypothetical protein